MIEHKRPDTVFVEDNKAALLIDIAVPGDIRVEEKEQEKVDKYRNLAWKLKRLWKVNTDIIPIVVGALRTIPKSLRAGTTVSIKLLQAPFTGYNRLPNRFDKGCIV